MDDRLAVGSWRLAVLTPLPPARTGVAHYSSMVIPALREALAREQPPTANRQPPAIDALSDWSGTDLDAYSHVIYQLGNNPHHERIYAEAMRRPGVVVLHDLVLHHLIVEMTLARGDADAYVAALEASHGPPGAAWARGRAVGLHNEMGNFLLPASVEVAQRARSVIVHNRYAHDRLRSFGVTTPIHVVPHPYVHETRVFPRTDSGKRVIGFFGFLTSAKRAEVVLDAFRIARVRDPRLELLIVGEPAPNIDLDRLRGEGIVMTGYVADDDFPRYYAIADRFVNLRYPSAGETSGTLIRALDAGKPVAVSDYAQFAELPDDVVFKVPLGAGEVERLVEFFTADLPSPAQRQREWLEQNAAIGKTVDGYLRAVAQTDVIPSASEGTGPARRRADTLRPARPGPSLDARDENRLPLFPQLEIVSADPLVIRNIGAETIRTRVYGQPEYRLIVKWLDGDRVVHDQWLALPKDLHPGETAEIALRRQDADTIRLYHALQDVPMIEPEAWGTARVR